MKNTGVVVIREHWFLNDNVRIIFPHAWYSEKSQNEKTEVVLENLMTLFGWNN